MTLPADRINLATNSTVGAASTNWAAVAGTSGTAALTRNAGTGYSGAGFARTAWTVATSAVSGGFTYTQTGLAASVQYAQQVWVRSSKVQTVSLTADFRNVSNTIINTVAGPTVTLVANTWTKLIVNATSGAAVTNVVLTAQAVTGGSNWANGDTFDGDAVLIEAPIIARTNWQKNPLAITAGTGFAQYASGTSETGTTTWVSGAVDGPLPEITTYGRWTVTTPKTAASTGWHSQTSANRAPQGGVAGDVWTASVWLRYTGTGAIVVRPRISFWDGGGVLVNNADSGVAPTLTSGVWTQLTYTAPATGTFASVSWFMYQTATTISAAASTLDATGALVEKTGSVGTFFSGDTPNTATVQTGWTGTAEASPSVQWVGTNAYFDGTYPPDSGSRYFWTGTANASTSHAEYRGVWVETVTGSGCPGVQITVAGVGPVASLVQVTRTADGETWTVPGWATRSVISADTDPDYAVPLGRTVTYTAFINGVQINQQSIVVASSTGWVQSPYDPTSAMPINTMLTDNAILTLAKGSLESRVHAPNSTRATAMGSKRPYSISGQRMADAAAAFVLHAWKNATSDQFKAMVAQAPVLLIRGLPSWGSVPGLAYLDAPAQEINVTRYKNYPNDGLTQWVLAGDLVQPISRKPITGTVTNDQVQTNLAGTTYNTILARSGSKKNVDIKANPLGL